MESSSNNNDAEVFVIPPNLLEKLGINLKSLNPDQSIVENVINANEPVGNGSNQDNYTKVNNKSSILETANLMKASVFCSPTFTNNVANGIIENDFTQENISDIIEIASSSNLNEYSSSNGIDNIFDNSAVNQTIHNNMDIPEVAINPTNHVITDKLIKPASDNIVQTCEDKLNKMLNTDDHSDEAYLSDCSNSNLEVNVSKMSNNGANNSRMSNNNLILSPKQIADMNSSCVPKNVTIKSVHVEYKIKNPTLRKREGKLDSDLSNSNKIKDNHSIINSINQSKESSLEHPSDSETNTNVDLVQSASNIGTKNCKNSISDIDAQNNDDRNVWGTRKSQKSTKQEKKDVEREIINSGDKNKVKKRNTESDYVKKDENDTSEKVNEIARYLCEINEKRKIMKRRKSISKSNDATPSKLPVHGVEKPGGDKNSARKNKLLSTYMPSKTKKQTPVLAPYPNIEVDINSITLPITNTSKSKLNTADKLHCICYDFGLLQFYETSEVYEHIHFGQRSKVDCDLDTMLSIYDEDNTNIVNYDATENRVLKDSGTDGELIINALCWCKLQIELSSIDIENLPDTVDKTKTIKTSPTDRSYAIKEPKKCDQSAKILDKEKILPRNLKDKIVKKVTNIPKALTASEEASLDHSIENVNKKKHKRDSNDRTTNKSIRISDDKKIACDDSASMTLVNCDSKTSEESSKMTHMHKMDSFISSTNTNKIPRRCSVLEKKTYDKITNKSESSINKTVGQKEQHSLCIELENKISDKSSKDIQNIKIKSAKEKQNSLSVDIEKATSDKSTKDLETSNNKSRKEKQRYSLSVDVEKNNCHTPIKESNITKYNKHNSLSPDLEKKISGKPAKDSEYPKHKFAKEKQPSITVEIQKKTSESQKKTSEKCTQNAEKQGLSVNAELQKNNWDISTKDTENKRGKRRSLITTEEASPQNQLSDGADIKNNPPGSANCVNEKKLRNIPEKESLEKESKTPDRRISIEVPMFDSSDISNTNVCVCGVCKEQVEDSAWLEHLAKNHNYLGWKENEPSLDLNDEKLIKQHLQTISNNYGGLVCPKCGLVRKTVKTYWNHINRCNVNTEPSSDSASKNNDSNADAEQLKKSDRKRKLAPKVVICGVCNESINTMDWIDHIRNEHDYLAWPSGEEPLNTNDETEVKEHLQNIARYNNGLMCKKCGIVRKYVKLYLGHIESCDGSKPDLNQTSDVDKTLDTDNSVLDKTVEEDMSPIVTCGVCKEEVARKDWIGHLTRKHKYMAWKEGEKPVNVDDEGEVYQHLSRVVKLIGELICPKCGVNRRYAKPYLQHITECDGVETDVDMYREVKVEVTIEPNKFICGVCQETGQLKHWTKHAMEKHYNVAWKLGDLPINIRNIYDVIKCIKEYNTKYELVCKTCGATRASHFGFYTHILTCEKTEEELKPLYDTCNICNAKYLCVYKKHHMTMHKEKELRLKKKEMLREEKKQQELLDVSMGSRRKAAEKAKKEIEHFAGENAKDREVFSDDSDADINIKIEASSEESSDDDVTSDASNEEEADAILSKYKKKKYKNADGSSKIVKIPFKVNSYNVYLKKSYEEFCQLHISMDTLFDSYRLELKDLEFLSEENVTEYLPRLKESCKIKVKSSEWTTLERFQFKKVNDVYTLFTGGCIRGMQWVPCQEPQEGAGHYLTINCHSGDDTPRYSAEHLHAHPAVIQIWNFNNFAAAPVFQLGLIHDYGTVWAFDWCPSGTRDVLPGSEDVDRNEYRLGLIVIACSNGRVYVCPVPYPKDTTTPEFVRIKPVVELRLSMSSERKLYQATSVCWVPQRGHEVILAGYADGTTAYYDLNTDSPFLKAKENGLTVLYPFQESKPDNTPITDVCGMVGAEQVGGAVVSSALGSAAQRGARGVLPAAGLVPMPHWPAALLVTDHALSLNAQNEIELFGGGRRLGGAVSGGGCMRCGEVAVSAPPALRLMRAHPCYPEIRKKNVAMLHMIKFGQKRKHVQQNDDLSMVIQPRTYADTITKYGLELTMVPKSDPMSWKTCTENEQLPERYPLSNVSALAFCPSDKYHNKLAMATHSGLVFIITT